MNRIQKGGELIGKGRDGYVYYGEESIDPPKSKCKNTTIKRGNRVAKASIREYSDKEWKETDTLRQHIDFFKKFAIFPTEQCESQDEMYSVLFSEYGGKSFESVYSLLLTTCRYFIKYKKYDDVMNGYLEELNAINLKDILERVISGLITLGNYLDIMNNEYGIWHNDIKSDNMVYTDDGTIKLIDFGEARLKNPGNMDSSGLQPMIDTLNERLIKVTTITQNINNRNKTKNIIQSGAMRRTRKIYRFKNSP